MYCDTSIIPKFLCWEYFSCSLETINFFQEGNWGYTCCLNNDTITCCQVTNAIVIAGDINPTLRGTTNRFMLKNIRSSIVQNKCTMRIQDSLIQIIISA